MGNELEEFLKQIQAARKTIKGQRKFKFVPFKHFARTLKSKSKRFTKRTSIFRPNRLSEQIAQYEEVGLTQGIIFYYDLDGKTIKEAYVEKKDKWVVEVAPTWPD